MDVVAIEASVWNTSSNKTFPKSSLFKLPTKSCPKILHCTGGVTRFKKRVIFLDSRFFINSLYRVVREDRGLRSVWVKSTNNVENHSTSTSPNLEFGILVKKRLILLGVCCGVLWFGCRRVLAAEGVLNGGYVGLDQIKLSFINSLPKVLMVLKVLKEQGLILAALFGLFAFFSMAETSITTLWAWKVFFSLNLGLVFKD